MRSDRFYLACLRDTVGSNVAFHAKDGCGYSTDIDRAHVYTRDEVQRHWNSGREFDLPLCADRVDALSVYHVDCQYIPAEPELAWDCTEYVAYQKGRWDGNDVYWLSASGIPTTDFAQAKVFDSPEAGEEVVCLPLHTADSVKRRTFGLHSIDRRRMIQSAGIITPAHVKRSRGRRSSGKIRWNCPGCGQIHWQFNPYDFDECRNLSCDLWRPTFTDHKRLIMS